MDERTIGATERPARPVRGADPASGDGLGAREPGAGDPPPTGLADPRALTVLTTEHWSILSHRALVYNEAFSRAGMFLTFLSATLVALGLVSTATGFSREFLVVASVVLAVDLFVGFATMGRMRSASSEDLRCLQGMNRLRHAYHEIVPGLEPYFVFGKHDDMAGVFAVYGPAPAVRSFGGIVHGLTTAIGMISVICASVAGVLGGVVVLLVTGTGLLAGLAAVAVFVVVNVVELAVMVRSVANLGGTLQPAFPSPASEAER